jgi:hypothetical protein
VRATALRSPFCVCGGKKIGTGFVSRSGARTEILMLVESFNSESTAIRACHDGVQTAIFCNFDLGRHRAAAFRTVVDGFGHSYLTLPAEAGLNCAATPLAPTRARATLGRLAFTVEAVGTSAALRGP